MLYKCCPNCGKVIDYAEKYCIDCNKVVKKDKAENNRAYDKNVRKNVNIYASKIWHIVRKQALILLN